MTNDELARQRAEQYPDYWMVKRMVERFLRWRLPEGFNPDGGITYIKRPGAYPGPTGTNLLDAQQAEVMVRYMLFGARDE